MKHKHKRPTCQNLCLYLPNQDPEDFRRILQYLYSQKFAVGDACETLQELCDGYILASKLELGVLQDKILHMLGENEYTICNDGLLETFLGHVQRVYASGEAKSPFRQFLRRMMRKSIENDRLDSSSTFVRCCLNDIVVCGGNIAQDIAQVLMDILRDKVDGHSNATPKAGRRNVKAKRRELQGEIEQCKSKLEIADLRISELESALASARAEAQAESAESLIKKAEARGNQLQEKLRIAEDRLNEMGIMAQSAEQAQRASPQPRLVLKFKKDSKQAKSTCQKGESSARKGNLIN